MAGKLWLAEGKTSIKDQLVIANCQPFLCCNFASSCNKIANKGPGIACASHCPLPTEVLHPLNTRAG